MEINILVSNILQNIRFIRQNICQDINFWVNYAYKEALYI